MSEPPKLCPFSLGFSIKQQMPNIIDTKRVDVRIQVGIPCLKEKCSLWSLKIEGCVIWLIASTLIALTESKSEVI